MRWHFINPSTGRLIVKAIKSNDPYSNWMRDYVSPKVFFFFRKRYGASFSYETVSREAFESLNILGIKYTKSDSEFFVRTFGSLKACLIFYYAGILKVQKPKTCQYYLSIIEKVLVNSRLFQVENFSIKIVSNPFKINSEKHLFIAPVCPDYSHVKTADGNYRYTFEGIGNGIGLVASKAISNAEILMKTFQDSPRILRNIDIKFLVGDFEAKERNLNSLGINYDSFIKKIEGSIFAINNTTRFSAIKFTDLCGGLPNWVAGENMIKLSNRIENFDDLINVMPSINHKNILISRIPLYRRWFSGYSDFKNIFVEQVIEYMLMGKIISEYYGSSTFLLASDHRAMRPYYTSASKINLVGSSTSY